MSDTALQNLQTAVETAAGSGPFALDATFLTQGLDDSSVTVPTSYDDDVKAAFQLTAAADLKVTVAAGDVGPVTDGKFTVAKAEVPFVALVSTPATLVFSTTSDSGSTALVVQIETAPADWTWNTSFPFMTGWPFDQLGVLDAKFAFSTADGLYPWGDDTGFAVVGGPSQNFTSSLPFPTVVTPFLVLFDGLGAPPAALVLSGALNLAEYNAETVLMPSGRLDAAVKRGTFEMFYLSVTDPRVRLTITAPGTDDDDKDQSANLSVAADIALGSDQVEYALEVMVQRPLVLVGDQANDSPTAFDVALSAVPGGALTPQTIIALAGGAGSYFSATPAVLQQFLADVGLQGLALSGQIGNEVQLSSVAVQIGTDPGKDIDWTPIPAVPAGLNFTIQSFNLDWSVLNPLDAETRQQNFAFATTFNLAPGIFKGATPDTSGVFAVEFTSGMQFYASFDGTATLSDFLKTLTNDAISLESSIHAELSNIKLAVDYTAKSFSFSSDFGAELPFLTIGGQPVLSISDGTVGVAAKTATGDTSGGDPSFDRDNVIDLFPSVALADTESKTVWTSNIGGLMSVGPVQANASVAYDGTKTPSIWNLKASLAQEIEVNQVINQFLDPGGSFQFPDFLPGDLRIKTFAIDATIPSGNGGVSSYSVDTTFSWLFELGDQKVGINPARIKISYDGTKPSGEELSGLAEGTWVYEAINLRLLLGYEFKPNNDTLFLEWEGFRASYTTQTEILVFSLKGWSLGSLIQALVRTIGDPYFTLPSPWDLLDQVSLDGLRVNVNLATGVQNRVTAEYVLSSPVNLGFMQIKGLVFGRDEAGKVTIAMDLSVAIPDALLDNVSPADRAKFKNLTDPGKGQDVKDLPSVPGKGNESFKLWLLVLGQKVGIAGSDTFADTKSAICALSGVPNTEGDENPVNPSTVAVGQPYYKAANNWLIAGHLGLLKVGEAWTVDIMVVFNDPDLYGLRLALGGPKAGGLAGLVIDIIYKKITDDIGVYQLEFTFPDAIRNLNFGTVSVTLPDIGIKIYTNGDFFIDIGFPYNLDFRRSFSISAVVYGVPVLGAGGFYFGKLSNATATDGQIPVTTQGTFDPVIVIGVGLQLGLGYNFQKGPLSAGFALTAFGIVEGVFATWLPYDQGSAGTSLESQTYYKVTGTVGLIGLLYGKIDFKIITASLEVKLTLSVSMTLEPYRKIPISATVSVTVSLKVKINLGLFSITISLSFSATVTAKFEIGSAGRAPWDDNGAGELTSTFLARRAALVTGGPDAAALAARELRPRAKRIVRIESEEDLPTINVVAAPQLTVAANGNTTNPADQQGAFVMLLAIDAPDAAGDGDNTGDTSFDILCRTFFPWVIDTLGTPDGDTVDLAEVATTVVSRVQLETYIEKLGDTANPALTLPELLQFMADSFVLNIETPDKVGETVEAAESAAATSRTLFPFFDGLSFSVPPVSGTDDKTITLASYTTATSGYRTAVADLFAEVEAAIEKENQQAPLAPLALADDPESMAALIFTDVFSMIGRQLLQSALDSLEDYAYTLKPTDTIGSIIAVVGADSDPALTPDDVALPNVEHNLSPGVDLSVASLVYTIQTGDTLTSVAGLFSDTATSDQRWLTTPAELIEANQIARSLAAGVRLELKDHENETVLYTTQEGDYFLRIAGDLKIDITALAAQTVLYDAAGLLASAQQLAVPTITYKTAPASGDAYSPDTLKSIAETFAMTVPALAAANTEAPAGLFSTTANKGIISVANLSAMSVGNLWDAVAATDEVAQAAGMVGRFLMFGLRLPNLTGLGLSGEFLYDGNESSFGLYQLTGQQFPTPATAPAGGYHVTMSRSEAVQTFVRFNGTTDSSVPIDLSEAADGKLSPFELLTVVTDWATAGNFQPSPSFAVLPQSSRAPRSFSIANQARWSTADLARLEQLTDRGAARSADEGGQRQPLLWPVPPALTSLVESRQARIQDAMGSIAKTVPLLPHFVPEVGVTAAGTGQTSWSGIDNWAWATRVDFQIKRLPSIAVTPDPSNLGPPPPQGPASAPSLPNAYEVVGPSSEDALRLEELLSAMDELGEDMLSSVSLLYAQDGSAGRGLVTPSDSEFLAFLAQTNLSTETNPARTAMLALAEQDGTPPRGIGNSPGEFVKLLWELSVVRSGGYFLYYEVAESGDGLPASLFDSSGTATVSMVVTLTAQGANSYGNALFNFTNGFVTTDNIDTSQNIVRLTAQSATAQTAPLTGAATETLTTLSDMYGPGPGRIAETNGGVELVAKRVIPIAGIVHQLSQRDVADPATALATLATYYSVGAQTPITGGQIQSHNPGVSVALGSVYDIPPLMYVVDPAPNPGTAPGNTLAEIARYYGLSLDAVAVHAADVGGLFAATTQLDIDSEVFELRASAGPGNLTPQLERKNLGDPGDLDTGATPAQKAEYAEAYMYSLYNTMSAGFAENVYFTVSPMGVPFGPQPVPQEPTPTNVPMAQRVDQRRALLSEVAEQDFIYTQTLGLGTFASVNPAAKSGGANLPDPADNPYVGVGTTAQVALRWQDSFGNTTVTPFVNPPPTYQGALNGAAAQITYGDRLIGLGSWPGVRANYSYRGGAGAPELVVNFALDTSAWKPGSDEAKKALDVVRTVFFQLHQDYSNLPVSVPGVDGNAVTMTLSNSLLADPDHDLTSTEAAQIRTFVGDCYNCVSLIAGGDACDSPPTAQLVIPVALAGLVPDENIIELDVDFSLRRNPLLVDPRVAALADGLSVSSGILPVPDVGEKTSFTQLATAIETAFVTDSWELKVGEGLRKAGGGGPDDQRSQQLWAARFGKSEGDGIHFAIGTEPSYYAPKPVATSLESRTVSIEDYVTGQTAQVTFTGADLNLWFGTTLDSIDSFLSAQYSTAAFILDKILGTDDPMKDGLLGQVLKAKQSLADNISSTVVPVLSTSADDPSSVGSAAEKLRQQLLNQIGAAYAAGAVVVYGLSEVSGGPPTAPAGPPSLYGQPGGPVSGEPKNQNYTLTPSRVPLGPSPSETGEGTIDPRVAFVFTTKNIATSAYVPLDLNFHITHLEFDRQSVPGIDGYIQSRWLSFVNGPFSYALGSAAANVPVVNRSLPTPPTVQNQTAQSPPTVPSSPVDLVQWNYCFDYLYVAAAQDTFNATIALNYQTAATGALGDDELDLFGALAQFISSYPAIASDLAEFLPRIEAGKTDDATVDGAKRAVTAYVDRLTSVATAYADSLNPLDTAELAALPELVEITFEGALSSVDDGRAQVELLNVEIDGVVATWDSVKRTISNGSLTLPAPLVLIEPDVYTMVAVSPPPENVTIAYQYSTDSGPPTGTTYLSYEDALNEQRRTICMDGLDALAYQNGLGSIVVVRNRILFPISDVDTISTTDYFLFRTPEVRFADPVIPNLVHSEFELQPTNGKADKVEAALDQFFAGENGLFATGTGTISVEVSMTSAYSYALLPDVTGMPRTAVPISMQSPTETSVETTTPPAFIAPLAASVAAWRSNPPTLTGGPQVNFELRVFGASSERQPLLFVRDLYLEVDDDE